MHTQPLNTPVYNHRVNAFFANMVRSFYHISLAIKKEKSMPSQQRVYVTLSPRMRKALELCAALDGSTPAAYGAALLNTALMQEIERHPALQEYWITLEREALLRGSWDTLSLPHPPTSDEPASQMKTLKSWSLSGSHPHQYEYGVDKEETYQGKPGGYLRSKNDEPEGFGTLMQMFKADDYRGKHLRFSAVVKAEVVEGLAGLWMRVDDAKNNILSFDNMMNWPIRGTVDWQPYEIVLDVPQESVSIAFGILLHGSGQVWINDIQFTEAGPDVPISSNADSASTPSNLDFTE